MCIVVSVKGASIWCTAREGWCRHALTQVYTGLWRPLITRGLVLMLGVSEKHLLTSAHPPVSSLTSSVYVLLAAQVEKVGVPY